MPIAEDVSTPAVASGAGAGTGGVIATAAFTPPNLSLLVAIAAVQWGASGAYCDLSLSDSAGGTWDHGVGQIGVDPSDTGFVRIATRYVPTSIAGLTVTAHTAGLQAGRFLAVRVLTGAASRQRGAASAIARPPTTTDAFVSITPRFAGSWVYGGSNTALAASAFTPNAATALAGPAFANATDGTSTAAWRQSGASPAQGAAVTLGGSFATTTNQRTTTAALEIIAVEAMPTAAELEAMRNADALAAMYV